MNTQYKKGVLNLCALALLHKRDCYGYEISDVLSQHIDIADGTVYPLLRKLKADGLPPIGRGRAAGRPGSMTSSRSWDGRPAGGTGRNS